MLHVDALRPVEYVGRSYCVSWAYPQHLQLYHDIGQSVCLDNGAFSFWTQKKPVNWEDFYKWAEPWLHYQTTWAIIPDVIEGDDVDNDDLLVDWLRHFDREQGAPVWHPHESLTRLKRLVVEWPMVCIGGSPVYPNMMRANWKARMVEAWDVICDPDGYPRTKIHLLRGLQYVRGPYPLYSADSASVARSWSGTPGGGKGAAPKQPWEMYAKIDGCNPPPRWHRPEGVQEGLFVVEGDTAAHDMEREAKPMVSTSEQVGLDLGIPEGGRRSRHMHTIAGEE